MIEKLHIMNTIFTSYDIANRRTQASLPDGTKWLYGYDRLSQVTSGDRVDAATNEPVANGSYRYAYDGIGNRTTSQDGSNADLRNYTANSLNQYISIFSPGVIPIRGRADADAKVAVTTTFNGISTTYFEGQDSPLTSTLSPLPCLIRRSGQDFSLDIPVDNSQGAVTAAVQVDALKHDGTLDLDLHRRLSGDYTVPAASPEQPTYNADGNLLTYDGWTCAWNAQDRLVSATKGDVRLEFNYDYLGRRFEKKVYESNALVKHLKFVYDGFKQIAEYDALDSNALANTYLWQPVGLDVPLLRNGGEFFVSDANKNIVALLDTTGHVTDTYVYDPFGNCTHTGNSTNPFRFSSEYFDEEAGLVYYNYRYYSPDLGRWLKRDMRTERRGDVHVYSLTANDSINLFDILGMTGINLYGIYDMMINNSNPYFIPDPYNLSQRYPDFTSDPNVKRIILRISSYTNAIRKTVSEELQNEKMTCKSNAIANAHAKCTSCGVQTGEYEKKDFQTVAFMYWNKYSPFFFGTFPLGQVLVHCDIAAKCTYNCETGEQNCNTSASCRYDDPFDFSFFGLTLDTYISFQGEWNE